MDLKLHGACRGDGLIYAKIEASGIAPGAELTVKVAADDGSPLPSWRYDADRNGESCNMVVVLPLLERGSQTVTVVAEAGDGSPESACLRLSMQKVKWESRLNYRLRKGLVSEIRDIEKRDAFTRVNFELGEAVEVDGTDELNVRVSVWCGGEGDAELTYDLIADNGERHPLSPVVTGKGPRGYGRDSRFQVNGEDFSFRIPSDLRSFTLVATDRVGAALRGFVTFEPSRFEKSREAGFAMKKNASVDPAYHRWFLGRRADARLLERQRSIQFERGVLFSIVVPLFHTPVVLFRDMVDSVLGQTYGHWELVLVNSTPDDAELSREVAAYQAADARIRCVTLGENRGIVGNTNCGIEAASGDYVCFLDHDDMLEPDALFEYARAIEEKPETGMLYCDEDKLLEGGRFANPFFKSDFNIDLLRCHNYVRHFLCVRKTLLDAMELPEDHHNGAQDHDIALKCSERTSAIQHVAKVLYHWRVVEGSAASTDSSEHSPKEYAVDAGATVIREHLDRLGIPAVVEPTQWAYTHHVKYLVRDEPLVSIVIPNKDCADMLDGCIRSIVEKTTYGAYEIVVVENNSTEQQTFDYYDELAGRYPQARVVHWPHEFNFSKIANFGAAESRGEYLLFLNNDTEVIAPEWLENMLGICQRDDVGAVGAKLLFPDGTLQHGGVVLANVRGDVAHHTYFRMPEEYTGYFLQADLTMDYSAVTGACLLTKRQVFEELDGFDERLVVAFNDIDYCLRVRERGLLVVYEPSARLYHLESVSRGYDDVNTEKRTRLLRESGIMWQRWAHLYVEGDPFFNPHLASGYYRLRQE